LQTSEIFDPVTLLLLAVAVIVFLRLRSVLGRRTGNERPRLDPYAASDAAAPRENNVITLPRAESRPSSQPPGRSVDERIGGVQPEDRALPALRDIAAADPSFELAAFLKGSKIAYEAIVTAYAHGDRAALRNLLAPEVYDSFNAVISERESRGETTEFSFVGIESANVVDAQLAGLIAHITVRFVSELVTAVRDRGGAVVEGDVKAVRQVTDIWTFARDVRSPNPNWRLVATDSPEV
jgi:predicted lipid-binding transport protein (Tim44 family)